MATKAAIVNGEVRQPQIRRQGENPVLKFFRNLIGNLIAQWKEFTQFLSDVRAEMRKVVTPAWKEVQNTTTVVIIAVFIFGAFFFVVDSVCSRVMEALYHKLGA
jgi:preprotein translocase SecE subunit